MSYGNATARVFLLAPAMLAAGELEPGQERGIQHGAFSDSFR